MFDKRLMKMCPESKKYIAGNNILQFFELCCNIAMILMIAFSVQNLYNKTWGLTDLIVSATLLAIIRDKVMKLLKWRMAEYHKNS